MNINPKSNPTKSDFRIRKLPTNSDDFVNFNSDVRDEFWELLQSSVTQIEDGDIVKGTVVGIDAEGVLLDIGFKSEGIVPISQFKKTASGELEVKLGDVIEVSVYRKETNTGLVQLSKQFADRSRGWSALTEAYKTQQPISGTGVSANRAGLIVALSGNITGFVPVSQSGLAPGEKIDSLIKKTFPVKILDLDIEQGRVILSRRTLVEAERTEKRHLAFANLREGDIIKGKVKAITAYGAFIDLGGFDGLLHISDMSWIPIKNPNDLVKVGDELEVIVLRKDMDTERIALGIKQKSPDPWTLVEKKYPVNSIVSGKVVGVAEYGVFIRLEEGIEGMVHISELSWTERITHPSELVKVGEDLKVKVLNIEPAAHRISLGLKQLSPSPWDGIRDKYPVGKVVKVLVIALTDYGAFVKLEEGVEGLIHISDFSWTIPVKHPNEMLQVGAEIDARILRIEEQDQKIGLGIKQLTADPWLNFIQKYPVGATVTGKITAFTDIGALVELEFGIEGVCRLNQLDMHRIKSAEEAVKLGQELQFKLLRMNKSVKQTQLSRRAFLEEQEKKDFESYKSKEPEVKTYLGELLTPQKNDTGGNSTDSTEKNKANE